MWWYRQSQSGKRDLRKQELWSMFEPTSRYVDNGIRRRIFTTNALHRELYTRDRKTTGGHKKKLKGLQEGGKLFYEGSIWIYSPHRHLFVVAGRGVGSLAMSHTYPHVPKIGFRDYNGFISSEIFRFYNRTVLPI